MLKYCKAILLFVMFSLSANANVNSSQRIMLGAEYLYFLPTFDDTYFVIRSPTFFGGGNIPTGTRENNDFDFRSGFKVKGAYRPCGWIGNISAAYSRLNGTSTRRLETTGTERFWATVGGEQFAVRFENMTGSAASELRFLYQRVDGLYNRPIFEDGCFMVECGLGLEYGYVRLREQYDFRSILIPRVGQVLEVAKTCGIGPQFGFDLYYLICQRACFLPGELSVKANFFSSLLVSKSELASSSFTDDTLFIDVSDSHTWRFVPAFHSRVGLNYMMCFSCWEGSLEVGYEFTSYFRALSRHGFVDDAAPSLVNTNYYDFDLQGLYVALTIGF